MSTTASRSVLRPFALLLSLLLAVAGLSLPAMAAQAAPGDVAGATLQWGVKASFRSYLTGPIAHGQWIANGVSDATPFGWSAGSGSAPDGAGTVAYPGSLRFQGHQNFGVPAGEYALDLTFSDVKVRITGATTAELVLDARSRGFSDPTTFVELNDVVFATLDLSAGTNGSTEGVVAYSGVPATLTESGATAFGGFYSAGTALDPVTFSWPVEAAPDVVATPVLTASPESTSEAGQLLTLTATVTPAVTGTVQFLDGVSTLGAPVAVSAGVATYSTAALTAGDHSFTAVFTATEDGYVGATSAAVAHAITAAPGTPVDPGVAPGNVTGGSTTWAISAYHSSTTSGRPLPSPADYTAPASFDSTTRQSSWANGVGTVAADGSAVLGFSGASVNYASTGNAWLRIADPRFVLDSSGNGTVTASVSYGTGSAPNAAATRGPSRITIVTLAGNSVAPTIGGDAATWAGLQGTWSPELLSFLAGDSSASPAIPGWTYAGTVTNATTFSPSRTPAPFTISVALPTFEPEEYDLGTFTWGISDYLRSSVTGRPVPSPGDYTVPASFDGTSRLSQWGGGSGTVEFDGAMTAEFHGTSVNYAPTGNAWLRFADPQVEIDASGNGTISALVSYRTGGGPATAPSRGPARIDIVALTGNAIAPVQDADSASWTGLTGTWTPDLLAFLAGDGGTIPAWTYSGTVTNATTFTPARIPAPISIELGIAPDPIATGVELSASPAETAVAGTTVQLTATVTPVVDGSVRFTDGATFLAEVPVSSGVATHSLAATVGSHAYRAEFVPTDSAYAGSISAVVSQTVTAPAAPAPGSLQWGVKASFRDYVLGPIANGSITTSAGAGAVSGGFWFPQSTSSYDAATGLGSIGYRGAVQFTGHAGVLNLRIADPVVRIVSPSSAVIVVATSTGPVEFATLDLARAVRSTDATGAISYLGAPATLTAAGATSFSGFYSAGTALDPVSFTIGSANTSNAAPSSRATDSATNTPADTPPATEGVESEETEFTEGGSATFTATGYQPGETGILAVIYSEPTVLADDLVADAAGAVTWTGSLPLGLTGEHTFTFQGSVDRGIVIDIAAAEVVGCPVEGAELDWGFKESFRAYIDGSIANGEWTTADGATYATPLFSWTNGSGGYDAETGDADLAFTGSITFTGHSGVLNTTVANPRIVIDGERAVLLLDISGTTQEGEAISSQGVEFVTLDLAAAEAGGGGDLVAFTGIPTTLTEAGAAAFGTYEAGTAFDPVDLRITVDPACVTPVSTEEEPTAELEPVAGASPLPWILGGVGLLALIAVVAVVLIRRNRTA